MAMIYSTPINIVRYNNGTLLKLTATTHEFTSYNYDAETRTGTFEPTSITISAKAEGNTSIGKWSYSANGVNWQDVESGQHGLTLRDNTLTIVATSDLFTDTNSNVTIMCASDDGEYYDTITITRTVDPVIAFRRVYTDIKLEKDKIALIASDEELMQFSDTQTMANKMAQIEVKADSITSTVTASYATKSYAEEQAGAALASAEEYADERLADYSTTTEMQSAINQKADSITASVSGTYATKDSVSKTYTNDVLHYLATPSSSGVTTNTPGWTTTVQTVTSTNKYLWLYHTYTYTDGTSKNSTPYIGGVYGDRGLQGETGAKGDKGDTGASVTGITEYYARNNDPSNPPADSAFSTGTTTPTSSNRYVWNYELISYSDGTSTKTTKHIAAVYGDTGSAGRGISSIVDYYAVNNSPDAPGDSSFSTAIKTTTATNKYLWNYELVTYSDGGTSKTGKRIIGTYGDKGDKGDTGDSGINTATIMLYKRGTTAPAKPTDTLEYVFSAHNFIGSLSGWSLSIPSGTDPCWAIAAVAASNSTTDTISPGEWTTQTKIIQDGTDGLNQATIRLYRRSATEPNKPTATPTYTFATGTLNYMPSGWSMTIPTGTDPCYTTSAAAISANATYTITAWNDVTKLVEDGQKGDKGDTGAKGDKGDTGAKGDTGDTGVSIIEVIPLYFVTALSQYDTKPASNVTETSPVYNAWTRAVPEVTTTYPYMYTCDQIKYDNDDYSWSSVVKDEAIISFNSRLNTAELQLSDESINLRVSKATENIIYGESLLLDTDAPTLSPVDATNSRRWNYNDSSIGRSYGAVENAPDGIKYGARFVVGSANNSSWCALQWYDGGYIKIEPKTEEKPETVYTIECYARVVSGTTALLDAGIRNIERYSVADEQSMTITGNSWTKYSWTFTAPEYDFDYYYTKSGYTQFYIGIKGAYVGTVEICGFDLRTGDTKTTIADQISQIKVTADTIRLQTTTLVWEAENSSLDEAGKLRMGNAIITDVLSGVSMNEYTDGYHEGLLLGRAQLIMVSKNDPALSITLPDVSEHLPIPGYTYIDENGEEVVVAGGVDPVVEELDTLPISLAVTPLLDTDVATIATNGSYGLSLAVNSMPIIKIGKDKRACFNFGRLFMIKDEREGFEAYTGNLTTSSLQTLTVVNGIICKTT